MEIWKDIKDYEGRYQISSYGRVRSIKRTANHIHGVRTVNSKLLKLNTSHRYSNISLSKNSLMSRFTIHRLAASHFIPNPEDLPQVNHIDGDRRNNHVSNLEWCTASHNQKHSYRIGLKSPINMGKLGSLNYNSKPVTQYDMKGNYIAEFSATHEACRITGINQGTLAACARGKRKSAGGYTWKYKD